MKFFMINSDIIQIDVIKNKNVNVNKLKIQKL